MTPVVWAILGLQACGGVVFWLLTRSCNRIMDKMERDRMDWRNEFLRRGKK